MKKVYLFCSSGMSTSLLAQKMQKLADQYNLPMEIKAFSDTQVEEVALKENIDVALLGPQVKYKYETIKKQMDPYGIPVQVIDQQAYGVMDAEAVLKDSIRIIKKQGK